MPLQRQSDHQSSVAVLPSIAIVIPYFGQWPDWMGYFVESCRANPTVDWMIFTDCGQLQDCPDNIHLTSIRYQDYCKLVSDKLGIPFAPENAYKLCDIKPALGAIHEEALQGYDFWAFGDLDVVYGDLRSYFTPSRLATKDLFATHARRISGHLCLIRNTAELRQAYRRALDWQTLLSSPRHVAFDEKAYSKIFLRHKNSPAWVRKLAAWRDPWLIRAEFIEAFTTPHAKIKWQDGSTHYPTIWFWKNGLLTNNLSGNQSFPYFHFMVWKKLWGARNIAPISIKDCHAFSITAAGFELLE